MKTSRLPVSNMYDTVMKPITELQSKIRTGSTFGDN